jgi:hypothetical protein
MSLMQRMEAKATILRSRERLADVMELAAVEVRRWNRIDRALREDGVPTAIGGPFSGLELTPAIANAAQVTINATEALLWPGAANTPIPANPQVPKLYQLFASGTSTTAATPGTFTLAPRLGTLITSPLVGIATGAITPVASATAAQWSLSGWLYVRTGGATAIAQGSFEFNMSATIGGGGPASATSNAVFGGISASFDSTVASALVFGAIATTSTTNTFTPQFIGWGSWN